MTTTKKTNEPKQTWHFDGQSLIGRPLFSFHDNDYMPHWSRYGGGHLNVEIEAEQDGSLHIETNEIAEGKKTGKETWATIPRAAVVDLVKFLQKQLDAKPA